MTIKFHEERVLRSYFPKDSEGQSQGLLRPLRSKWIPRATGAWVRVWGVTPEAGYLEQDFEVSLLGMSAFEGPESGFEYGDVGGNEDLDAVLTGLPTGASGNVSSTPVDTWTMSYVSANNGRMTYSGSVMYEFENLGIAYHNLALRLRPHTFVETDVEPPVTHVGNPIWVAAKIMYRVEH